ncbi:hypothetical protein G6F59_016613 [Rhizopus arrhizus]|nr:hypothetical protein G6F59_016613 [Rhizopus arrhizus]
MSLALSYAIKEASTFFAWAIAANRHGVAVPNWITSLPVVGERLGQFWESYIGQPQALGALVEAVSGEHLGNIYRMVLAATGNVTASAWWPSWTCWANASCRRAGSAFRAWCRPPSTPPSRAWA